MADSYNPFAPQSEGSATDPLAEAFRAILKLPEGRAVVWEMLAQTRVYNETFAGNSSDIYEKGRRSVGLWLIAQIGEVDPTAYPNMLLEVARQQQRDEDRAANQQKEK